MVRSLLTRSIVWAAARDCGNRSMKAGNRTAWNEDDYNTASSEATRLFASPEYQDNE